MGIMCIPRAETVMGRIVAYAALFTDIWDISTSTLSNCQYVSTCLLALLCLHALEAVFSGQQDMPTVLAA